MALLGFEGFDHLASGASIGPDLVTKPGWSAPLGTSSVSSKVSGQLAGSAISGATNSVSPVIAFAPGSTYATMICGFRFKASAFSALHDFFAFRDGNGNANQIGLSTQTDGKLRLWRGSNATTVATGATVLVANSWYFLEIKVTFHGTTGSYELRLGGATEVSGSGVNTISSANAYATAVRLALGNFALSTADNHVYDDFYLCDNSGSAPHNDFLGIIRVETLYPTTDDSVTWTKNGGSNNFGRVSETAMDSDTSYNSSSSSGDIDLFGHGSLSSTPATIFAVQLDAVARKDDVSNQTIRSKLKSGATTQNGASNAVATIYQRFWDQYTSDPDTAAAWTTSGVNGSKIGYEHV